MITTNTVIYEKEGVVYTAFDYGRNECSETKSKTQGLNGLERIASPLPIC